MAPPAQAEEEQPHPPAYQPAPPRRSGMQTLSNDLHDPSIREFVRSSLAYRQHRAAPLAGESHYFVPSSTIPIAFQSFIALPKPVALRVVQSSTRRWECPM